MEREDRNRRKTPARLDLEAVRALLEGYMDRPGENAVRPEEALLPELAGLRLLERPLIACSAADDPLYRALKRPEAVGPWHMSPEEWLPGARSVLAFFFPFPREISRSNGRGDRPSPQWLHGRIEGQALMGRLCRFLAETLEAAGWRAVVPALDPRFAYVETAGSDPRFPPEAAFSSRWSERHAAYVSGLGTFGLSRGLITEKGTCGRFASVITDMPCPPTPRPYTGLYDYCTRCGACAVRCPVDAISPEAGKDQAVCKVYVDWTKREYAPRYGCGKCQILTPCRDRIPPRRKPS